tara:strand:+ start:3235 stop:4260 length:1026 start_codon:yes stop_codon:yes gene_type:complete
MSVRNRSVDAAAVPTAFESPMMNNGTQISALHESNSLGEGVGFNTTNLQQPLKRTVVASVKATLGELCTTRMKGVWAPSQDSLRSIFQNTQFTDLSGTQEQKGDLTNTVLHSVTCTQLVSTFPIALGVDITGVDANTYAQSGTAYSTIVLPNSSSTDRTVLQQDDPQVAYDFMSKYPGYTAANLETNGVHAVPARRFVLVSGDHPIMTAIKDNQSSLQTDEFAEMPEGLVKMSTTLYDAVMPIVKQQVAAQVRVRDYSRASISLIPSEYTSWEHAMESITADALKPLKEAKQRELACAATEDAKLGVTSKFDGLEQEAMTRVNTMPLEFHISLSHEYNFMG